MSMNCAKTGCVYASAGDRGRHVGRGNAGRDHGTVSGPRSSFTAHTFIFWATDKHHGQRDHPGVSLNGRARTWDRTPICPLSNGLLLQRTEQYPLRARYRFDRARWAAGSAARWEQSGSARKDGAFTLLRGRASIRSRSTPRFCSDERTGTLSNFGSAQRQDVVERTFWRLLEGNAVVAREWLDGLKFLARAIRSGCPEKAALGASSARDGRTTSFDDSGAFSIFLRLKKKIFTISPLMPNWIVLGRWRRSGKNASERKQPAGVRHAGRLNFFPDLAQIGR